MITPHHLRAVRLIYERLRETQINWVITGSLGFALHGMNVDVHDIDIQTDRGGAYEIEHLFREYVVRPVRFSSADRIQSHLGALEIDGLKVEIIGDIQKLAQDGGWEPPVDPALHREWVETEGMTLPVLSLEYEYQAYLKLGRAEKAEKLREWLSGKHRMGRRISDKDSSAEGFTIRLATEDDLSAINDIFNCYVLRSTCTWREDPETLEARTAWFASHDADHPVTVAEADGRIVGWGALSAFKQRPYYRRTVEDSVYVRHDVLGRGIGRALLADLIERAKGLGHHTIIARIDADQGGSIALHEKFGFVRAGHLREVGIKFGRLLGIVYLQLMLEQG